MTSKPLVFVSHSSLDGDLALSIAAQVKSVFGDDHIEVFVSSDDDAIDAASDWFIKVENALRKTEALVVLVTPKSIGSRWVWFEIGYIWRKMGKEKYIYPLALSSSQEIPSPLNSREAKALDSEGQVRNFFKSLCKQFGSGDPENADFEKLIEMARNSPEYPRQENLSEQDIKVLLQDYLKHSFENPIRYFTLDERLEIPRGSSKKYLKEVAQNNEWKVDSETHNTITLSSTTTLGHSVAKWG